MSRSPPRMAHSNVGHDNLTEKRLPGLSVERRRVTYTAHDPGRSLIIHSQGVYEDIREPDGPLCRPLLAAEPHASRCRPAAATATTGAGRDRPHDPRPA